ncbi:plasmid mobilization protein [Ligilactobacillus murinus]|uniref:plasmid mobilization protein n=1 Tax=Ligilactobacillus murinus TaxID=1622 RepID=UPI001CDB100B
MAQKMRKRNIQKIVRFNRDEAQDLQKKAKKACLSEAGLIRLLLRGYEPREKPDERFYDVMRELSSIGNNINQLAVKANTLGFVDAPQLKKEAERWHKFQADIERTYLRPDKSEMKWQ